MSVRAINLVPPEIWEIILRRLDFNSLKSFSAVCIGWKKISLIDVRFKSEKVVLDLRRKKNLDILYTSERKFSHVFIDLSKVVHASLSIPRLSTFLLRQKIEVLEIVADYRRDYNKDLDLKIFLLEHTRIWHLNKLIFNVKFFYPISTWSICTPKHLKIFTLYHLIASLPLKYLDISFVAFLVLLFVTSNSRLSAEGSSGYFYVHRKICFLPTREFEKNLCEWLFDRLPERSLSNFFANACLDSIENWPRIFYPHLPQLLFACGSEITIDETWT